MARRWRWIARPWLLAAAAIAVAGCGVSTPSAAPTALPNLPNGPIDIGGGRHLNINCTGAGPVVILDGGLGNTSAVWTPVVRLVPSFATVCSYDRAGQGGSDSRPLPHGAESAADDLHALLVAGKLPGPYVIVGASFGGLVVQIFARRFPTETAGVVLVDSLANGWDRQLESGILSAAQVAERRAIPNGEEITNEEIRASEIAAGAGPAFPAVPLVVLQHGQPFPGGPDWPTAKVEALWSSLQGDLAALSPRSTLLVAAQSGHRIHEQQPDLVADAIHAIVDPSRWPPTTT
jgi:pimeloyl-ACP methyl ester carboxylesterase